MTEANEISDQGGVAAEVEIELGVPIAGRILPVEQWVSTAIHRLPEGRMDWAEVFGRRAPLILDVGCGNGRYTIASAVARPECDHMAIDLLPVVIRYATRRGKQRGLANTRFAVCDGLRFLRQHCEDGCATEIHIYHPQPFHDPHAVQERLFGPTFLREIQRVLAPAGWLYLQSDNAAYWEYIRSSVSQLMDWEERNEPWDGPESYRSRREIIARNKGYRIFRGRAKRRDLDATELEVCIASLPEPTFQASPKRNRTGWTRNGRRTRRR